MRPSSSAWPRLRFISPKKLRSVATGSPRASLSETQQSAVVAGPTVTTGSEQISHRMFSTIRSQSTRRKAPSEAASLFWRFIIP